jgi:two-component system, NtrC family, sensor histidine kinase GlrK
MRLGTKLFLTTSVIIVALVALSGWSLLATNRLVEVNRDIVTRSLPAMRLEMSLRQALDSLVRLEARALLLREEAYAKLWSERAAQAAEDLEVLRSFLTTDAEIARHAESATAFAEYRRLVGTERAQASAGNRAAALRLAEGEARVAAERAGSSLDELMAATYRAIDQSQAEALRLQERTMHTVGAGLALALIVALAAVGVLTLTMTRSLRRLSAATAQVAEGAFRAPLPVRGRDEISELTRSFNLMAERLREAEQAKEEFFSHISHELRTPLTSVREATHLLLDRVPGPLEPKQARLVEIVRLSSERLLRLVNQLLEMSRLRSRVVPLERRPVDLDKLVSRAVDELRPQAEECQVTVTRATSGVDFTLSADEDRLTRVVVNLLDNAIKFTPPGGRVAVVLRDLGDEIVIGVEDTGIGIPASVLPRIFEPYRQAHGGRVGSGLGLAIVKGLVAAHGGAVEAASEEGRGSRFEVRLPRRVPGG